MIYIYNESDVPFKIHKDGEESRNSLVTYHQKSMRSEDGKTISISIASDYKVSENIEKLVSMKQPKLLCPIKTDIYFSKKSANPIIHCNTSFNKDILLMSIVLNGSIITNITTTNVFVLDRFIHNNVLCLAIAITSKPDVVAKPSIQLVNIKTKRKVTYIFSKGENGGYGCEVKREASTDENITPTFSIDRFRPSSPTHVIFAHFKDVKKLKESPKFNEKFNRIISYSTKEDIIIEVAKIKKEGYTAVTLFIDSASIDPSRPSLYQKNYELLNSEFFIFNVLFNNGKVLKVKKEK